MGSGHSTSILPIGKKRTFVQSQPGDSIEKISSTPTIVREKVGVYILMYQFEHHPHPTMETIRAYIVDAGNLR